MEIDITDPNNWVVYIDNQRLDIIFGSTADEFRMTCEHCQYIIEYLDEDKYHSICGACGLTKELLIKIEEEYTKRYMS